MTVLSARLVEGRHNVRSTSGIKDTIDGAVRENNDAVCAPRARPVSIAQSDRPASGSINLLQFSVGEKADKTTIRRPEWTRSTVGLRQRHRNRRLQRSHEELTSSANHPLEDYLTAVWRNGRTAKGK